MLKDLGSVDNFAQKLFLVRNIKEIIIKNILKILIFQNLFKFLAKILVLVFFIVISANVLMRFFFNNCLNFVQNF